MGVRVEKNFIGQYVVQDGTVYYNMDDAIRYIEDRDHAFHRDAARLGNKLGYP